MTASSKKLARLPTLRLSQMQDVGGCRVVLDAPAVEVDPLAATIAEKWDVLADDDYVRAPRPDGYRARHLVVRHSGVAIEVQLRTFLQDRWAEFRETAYRDFDLVAGERAEVSVERFFRDLSALMAGMEDGTLRAEALMEAVSNLLSQHMEALNALLRRPTP